MLRIRPNVVLGTQPSPRQPHKPRLVEAAVKWFRGIRDAWAYDWHLFKTCDGHDDDCGCEMCTFPRTWVK